MHIRASTLDDLMHQTLEAILRDGAKTSPTREAALEISGVLLELEDPRARLSRSEARGKIFSCLGELFWYLSGTNSLSFITHYIPAYSKESSDEATVHGGYGPRLFDDGGINQVKNIIDLLKNRPQTRRAVIQIFDAADNVLLEKSYRQEVPCTCTLQFLNRSGKLHMFVNMRSNDAYLGLPHDIFAFTMIQEIIARSINVKLGTYKHFVGSLHLYQSKKSKALSYLGEGFQSRLSPMPPMPLGNPWPAIREVQGIESRVRKNERLGDEIDSLDSYWADIALMLQVYNAAKRRNEPLLRDTTARIRHDCYNSYLEAQIEKATADRQGDFLHDMKGENLE